MHVSILSPNGSQTLAPLVNYSNLQITLAEMQAGVLQLVVPQADIDHNILVEDGRIVVREINAVWFIRTVTSSLSGGNRSYTVTARHANDLVSRRIVREYAGVARSSKTDYADDMMKDIMREQFVSPTVSARTMPGLSVAADLGAAPSISKSFAWRAVSDVLREIAEASATAGTYLGYEVVPSGTGLLFATYTGQRGTDRRNNAGLLVSEDRGNLTDASFTRDWSQASTVVIAGGQGEGTLRATAVATDTTALLASPYAYREAFRQATQSTTSGALQAEADAELRGRRAQQRFNGTLQDVPGMRYGVEYGWGDILPVVFDGTWFACRVDPVRITVGPGEYRVDVRLTSDGVLA